jgi:hypothetical protein
LLICLQGATNYSAFTAQKCILNNTQKVLMHPANGFVLVYGHMFSWKGGQYSPLPTKANAKV